eukprot:758541-Hanusia_phi.AAC.3
MHSQNSWFSRSPLVNHVISPIGSRCSTSPRSPGNPALHLLPLYDALSVLEYPRLVAPYPLAPVALSLLALSSSSPPAARAAPLPRPWFMEETETERDCNGYVTVRTVRVMQRICNRQPKPVHK